MGGYRSGAGLKEEKNPPGGGKITVFFKFSSLHEPYFQSWNFQNINQCYNDKAIENLFNRRSECDEQAGRFPEYISASYL